MTVADQAALAKWCRKRTTRQDDHWLSVLQLQPHNPDAIKGLGLHSYQGMLLTNAQIAQVQGRGPSMAESHRAVEADGRKVGQGHREPQSTIIKGIWTRFGRYPTSAEMLALESCALATTWLEEGRRRATSRDVEPGVGFLIAQRDAPAARRGVAGEARGLLAFVGCAERSDFGLEGATNGSLRAAGYFRYGYAYRG